MYPKQVAAETAKVLQSYLTYQAIKTIIAQLAETNPPMALWLTEYSSGNKVQDGEAYLQGLMLEHKDLVIRILEVRENLAEQVLDFLPEMVRQNLQQSGLHNRRQLLERLTRSLPPDSDTPNSNIS
ncbi:chaperonin family protein RbcX [Gloeocapsa sp. PCC 73106]|uniref:chaperonin family protein RbcX n=1 Tax=Gloeocapsa sp. PCC 73106 TaxID=102232 RepID=UPI0002AC91C4|nr:chaperonin family protein RbcX [Gloeocapsa sp. PCC 73106]ELR99549.1 RbcX protein [Gloeocapsa sp. PCC 73106]